MKARELNKKLKEKLNALAVVSNENRFGILLALLTSSVLKLGKFSHTFTELKEISGLNNPDLSYHLIALRGVGLIVKKDHKETGGKSTYYSISSEGKEILKNIGITSKTIKDTKKKVA